MKTPAEFGDALGKALASSPKSQSVVAGELGVSTSTMSSWKLGQPPALPAMVFALEGALDLPPGHLSRHLGYLPVDEPGPDDPIEAAIVTLRRAIGALRNLQ